MKIGEDILTVQIIGFICILNEFFLPIGLSRVEFVGNQKIHEKRRKRRNDIHFRVFQHPADICKII